jgi:hypothetical protein
VGKIDSMTLTGASGREYAFRVYVWETKFKPLPGVYVVASRTIEPGAAAAYQPLFVGMTADLSKALANHPRLECFQMYYANTIGVLKEADAEERGRIVADLTQALQPHCNGDESEWRG